jgi:hypothetical protein
MQTGTVPVTGPIAPPTETDTFATHQAIFGKGGLRSVGTAVERDAIPTGRREAGMIVYVNQDGSYWKLNANLTSWTQVPL